MMGRFVIAAILAAGMSGADAEQAPKTKASALRTWFKHLKDGLAESSVAGHYQKSNFTAVAAVRGAQQDVVQPDKPQWKGSAKSKKARQLKKEKDELSKSVDLILEGKLEEGSAGLDAFEKAHPKSSLMPEVRESREKVQELGAASAETPAENSKASP